MKINIWIYCLFLMNALYGSDLDKSASFKQQLQDAMRVNSEVIAYLLQYAKNSSLPGTFFDRTDAKLLNEILLETDFVKNKEIGLLSNVVSLERDRIALNFLKESLNFFEKLSDETLKLQYAERLLTYLISINENAFKAMKTFAQQNEKITKEQLQNLFLGKPTSSGTSYRINFTRLNTVLINMLESFLQKPLSRFGVGDNEEKLKNALGPLNENEIINDTGYSVGFSRGKKTNSDSSYLFEDINKLLGRHFQAKQVFKYVNNFRIYDVLVFEEKSILYSKYHKHDMIRALNKRIQDAEKRIRNATYPKENPFLQDQEIQNITNELLGPFKQAILSKEPVTKKITNRCKLRKKNIRRSQIGKVPKLVFVTKNFTTPKPRYLNAPACELCLVPTEENIVFVNADMTASTEEYKFDYYTWWEEYILPYVNRTFEEEISVSPDIVPPQPEIIEKIRKNEQALTVLQTIYKPSFADIYWDDFTAFIKAIGGYQITSNGMPMNFDFTVMSSFKIPNLNPERKNLMQRLRVHFPHKKTEQIPYDTIKFYVRSVVQKAGYNPEFLQRVLNII